MSKQDFNDSIPKKPAKVTIKDIAREAGVSYSTVSRALNDHEGTSEKTKKRIRKIAKRMGYQANTLARSLATRESKMIGVILPDLTNEFFMDILREVSFSLTEAGYGVLIYESNWDLAVEAEGIRKLTERMVDGIILYPAATPTHEELEDVKLPLVLLHRVIHEELNEEKTAWPRAFVNSDNELGGELAVEHLADCGYQNIIYLGGPDSSDSHHKRLKGIKRKLKELGFPEMDERFVEGAYEVESGQERCAKLLTTYQKEGREVPDAIIAGNDLIGIGCMASIVEAGFKVGSDIGVVGFDDVSHARLPQIQLTTVRVPRQEMGRVASAQILELLKKPHAGCFDCELLKPRLIARKTTCKVQ